MKKVLSMLLAVIMVVTCMVGITFNVAAETTEVDLFSGNNTGNIGWSTDDSTFSVGEILTITEGNAATGIKIMLGGGAYSMNFSVYRYDSSKSILANVAAAPLYTKNFTSVNNAWNEFTFDNAITGPIYWELTMAKRSKGMDGMLYTYDGVYQETEGGPVTGVQHVMNGAIGAGFVSWNSASKALAAKLILDDAATATTTDAPLTEETPLYGGNHVADYAIKTDTASSYGQKFSVPTNRKVSAWAVTLAAGTTGNVIDAGTIAFYQWNTDYATTVAAAPLYTQSLGGYINRQHIVDIPDSADLTGDLLWVYTPAVSGKAVPFGGTALAAGVTDFINGEPTKNCGGSTYNVTGWGNIKTIGATVVLTERVSEEWAPQSTITPLFTTVGGSQYGANTAEGHKAVIGQSFTVPTGEILTSVNFRYMCTSGYAGTAKGTFALYQWAGTYAETVSTAPLYSIAVSYANNAQNISVAVPQSLMVEGEVLWTLTPDADSAYAFNPWGAKDQIAGVHSYYNGVADKKMNGYGEWIESTITTLNAGMNGALESSSSNLFTGALSYNAAIWSQRSQYTGDGYGQIIQLEDGQRLTSMSNNWMYWGGNTTVTIEFFQYAGDALNYDSVAATLAGESLYSYTVTPAHNGNTTIMIPSDVMLTGLVMWYVRDPFNGGAYTQSVVPGGASGYIGNVLNVAGGKKQGTATGVTGWSNAAATDTIATWITTAETGITYVNAVTKEVIASGSLSYGKMSPLAQDAFAAKANAYADGAWGEWDGTFTHVGNGVYYTNHNYDATFTVNGESVATTEKYVTVEANAAGFVGWKDNTGKFISNSVAMKWYPQKADAALVAVYEGTFAAGATATATSEDGKLTVTVTPALTEKVTEYGFYLSVGTAIDTANLDGVTKVTANNAFAAYLQRVYSIKPATAGQTVYVVTYIVVDGVTTYGTPVTVVA